MKYLEELKEHYGFEEGSTFVSTHLDQVRFFWSTIHGERAPLIYNSGLVIVLQGHKIGYLNEEVFHYDANQFLVLSVPIAFECESIASPKEPLFGLFIDLDMPDLKEVLSYLPQREVPETSSSSLELGIQGVPLSSEMKEALERLLEILCSKSKSQILGKGVLREVLYHALQGGHRSVLESVANHGGKYEQISQTIQTIRSGYQQDINVNDLASAAGMSLSVYHRAFKKLTGVSPLQYLKTTRLHRAKEFIIAHDYSVSSAAFEVGYASVPHFSREFKKHFGVNPKQAHTKGYGAVDI